MKKKRIYYLDLIRVVALIIVIIGHYNFHINYEQINGQMIFDFIPMDNLRKIGVSLFIIISGAVLMKTYETNFNLKTYFIKRFLSIYPIFWTGYIIAFLFNFYLYKDINEYSPGWTFILTIIGMDGYLYNVIPNFYLVGEWFLGFILLFYIIFPILRKYVIEKPVLLGIVTSVLYILSIYMNSNGLNPLGRSDIFSRLPEFLFGMYFIYYIKRSKLPLFIISSLVTVYLTFSTIPINIILHTTILGMSTFLSLVFIGEYINNLRVKNLTLLISKYSFPALLINQIIMSFIMQSFTGVSITIVESYTLFIIVFLVITFIAILITRLSKISIEFFKRTDKAIES